MQLLGEKVVAGNLQKKILHIPLQLPINTMYNQKINMYQFLKTFSWNENLGWN